MVLQQPPTPIGPRYSPPPYPSLFPDDVSWDDLHERFPPRMEGVGLFGDPAGDFMLSLNTGSMAGAMNTFNSPKNGGICGKASFPKSLFDASDQLETIEHGCEDAPSFGSFEGGSTTGNNNDLMTMARQNYKDVLGSFGFTVSREENQDRCLVFRVKHTTFTIRHTSYGSFISPSVVEGNIRLPCGSAFGGGSFNFGGVNTNNMELGDKASASRTATVRSAYLNIAAGGQMRTDTLADTGWKPGNGNHPGPDFDQVVDTNPFSDNYEDVVPGTLQELGSLDQGTVTEVLNQLKYACENPGPNDPVISIIGVDPDFGPYAAIEGTTTTMEIVSIQLIGSIPCVSCMEERTAARGAVTGDPKSKGLWDYFTMMRNRSSSNVSYGYGNNSHTGAITDYNSLSHLSKGLGLLLGQLLGGMAFVEAPDCLDYLEQVIQNAVNDGSAAEKIGEFVWDSLIEAIVPANHIAEVNKALSRLGRIRGISTVEDALKEVKRIKKDSTNGMGGDFLEGFGLTSEQIDALQKEGYTFENLLNASPFPTKGLCEVVDALQKLLDADPSTFGEKVKERIKKYFSDEKFGTQTLEDLIFNRPAIERAVTDLNQGKKFPPTLPDGGGNYLLGISNSLNTP